MDQLMAMRAFTRVVETGSFTRAADSLNMPIATLSKLVKALEAHLEIRLLHRTTRRVVTTPEGAEYYEKALRVLIDIEDIDYGIWYVDMMDNLDKYVDKTVRFKGQVLKSRELNAGFFVPGRMAMTCCADDTQFIGYICKNPAAKRLRIGSWVTVTAKVKDEFMEVYNGRGPVLYATEIEAAEKPEQELVYFG